MSALAKNRKTSERVPSVRQYEAASNVYAGSLVAVNADGKAVPASDTAGLSVAGRAENQAGAGGIVSVKSGCFLYKNAASPNALSNADAGKVCYVADDQTVGKNAGTNGIAAGRVYEVTTAGVWVIADPCAIVPHNHDALYSALPTPAAAVADVTDAGENSANLISAVNSVLAVLRSNDFIATA